MIVMLLPVSVASLSTSSFTSSCGERVGCTCTCRCGRGIESPELAESWKDLGCYSPHPAQDVWAFGLLLLRTIGGNTPKEHNDAILAKDTRAYSATLIQAPVPYNQQVRLVS